MSGGNGNGNGKRATQGRPIETLIGRLAARNFGPEQAGGGQWRSCCPSHRGESKNLMIRESEDGTVLLHCHHADEHGRPTCSAASIVEALGLALGDLFGTQPGRGPAAKVAAGKPEAAAAPATARGKRVARPAPSADAAIAFVRRKRGDPSAWWDYHDAQGSVVMRVYRFETPAGGKEFLPVHLAPDGWRIGDPPGPLPLYHLDELSRARLVVIAEGEKCADLVRATGLVATTSAHGSNAAPKSDWSILAGKDVVILPDNDAPGRGHAETIGGILWDLEPRPRLRILRLPRIGDGEDVEQWLATLPAAWTDADRRGELLRLADEVPYWTPPPADGGGAVAVNGYANFAVRITREIVRHDGDETTRHVEVEAIHHDGGVARAVVAAADFEAMNWVATELGLKYVLDAGRNIKDRFQHAIRVESFRRGVETRHVYGSLGWERSGGVDYYLHAGGAVAAPGVPVPIDVELSPELALFRLPAADPGKLPEATSRVLATLDQLGPAAATVAAIVVALPFRAVLGPSRTIPHFAGTSGTYKTSTASLAVRYFAPSLEYSDSMPLSWSSTSAGLERLRHTAKDSLLIIDNLIADGDHALANRELQKADIVFNSQGDLAGRGRMRADGTTSPRLDPRGCVISTGECEPRRRSAAGRSILIEFRPGLVDFEGLKRCHADARDGWYAQAMACYVQHLAGAGRLAAHRAELLERRGRIQAAALASCAGCHPRHAEAVAEWSAAWDLFLRFAVGAGAVSRPLAEQASRRVRDALFETLTAQADIQEEGDFGEIFLELCRSLLASNRVVLAGTDGRPPEGDLAGACGWQRIDRSSNGRDSYPDWDQAPGSVRIGWVDEDRVYLEPNAAHAAAERLARELGRVLGSQRQVQARLAETDRLELEVGKTGQRSGRRYFTRKVSAEGGRPRALWMSRKAFFDLDPASDPAPEDGADARRTAPY